VTRAEVAEVLRFVGEDGCYGLRSVSLAGSAARPDGLLGRLTGPGEIALYAPRPTPWILRGALPEEEATRLRAAGARLEARVAGGIAVHWTQESLKAFVLLDVLLHEIGHHRLQHESRRPTRRAARTREHEAAAERFARRMRERWHATHRA
jgi:hypothetical protein